LIGEPSSILRLTDNIFKKLLMGIINESWFTITWHLQISRMICFRYKSFPEQRSGITEAAAGFYSAGNFVEII
jgi:hypothetical protein